MALNISKGKKELPILALIYALDGKGKTTLAASAPNPIIIDLEGGSNELDVARIENIDTFEKLLSAIDELAQNPQGFETMVIDSVSPIEPWIWAKFKDPGYGRGSEMALTYWRKLTEALNRARAAGFNILLIAHAWPTAANDPTVVTPYDKMGLRLDKKAAAFFREYVYAVFYLASEISVHKENDTDRKGKAFDADPDARIVYTVGNPAYDAKSRYDLPSEIKIGRTGGWEKIFGARINYEDELIKLIPLIKDDAVREKAQVFVGDGSTSPGKLYKRVKAQIEAEK